MFLFRENFTFYYTLGVACLYAGDFGGAFSYLQRALQLNPKNPHVLLGLAAVYLRRRQVTDALQCWLQVLDSEPRNPIAKKGLSLVKTTDDPSAYVTMAESGRLNRYYPTLGFRVPRAAIPLAAVTVAAVAVVLLWPKITELLDRGGQASRQGSDLVTLDTGADDLTSFEGEFRYVMTEDEIERTFERIGDYFNDFRDNLAQREVNRLLVSNASDLVKERARLISEYFREPTFVDFADNFSFDEVAAEPWLYSGCYVRWSGQVSNISTTDESITFTLLVGYTDERVLEGTIPVRLNFTADVQPGPVELIGQLAYDGQSLSLRATSIRRIAPGRQRN